MSPAAEGALAAAADLARRNAARVTILNVIDLSTLGDSMVVLRLGRDLRADAMPRLEELSKTLSHDVPVEIKIIDGVAAVSIARYARDHAIDLSPPSQ